MPFCIAPVYREVFELDLTVDCGVNCHDRSETAANDATDCLDRKFAIRGDGIEANSEHPLEFKHEVFTATQVAGSAHTYLNAIATGFGQFEKL